ncbi:helix-turn-helix domain-containing protein [Actinopolymorpha sp. B17G11]|uniref:helix-turn-helix domain-containing protein n=1 Tax=Actinopolymorpha sp. B17G11 TaxID=3160861 RepID=UPI0032E46985
MTTWTWWNYVQIVTEGASFYAIGRTVGRSPSTIMRWRHSTPKPATVRAFAQAYGVSVIDAMVAAGHLDADDTDPAVLREQRDEIARAYTELLAKVRALGGAS